MSKDMETSTDQEATLMMEEEYNSDEEPLMECAEDRLSWRKDPIESLSDWTIEIVYKTNDTMNTDTYRVHKHFLAVGPRKSEYFVRLFRDGGRFSESQSSTSRIELEEITAKVFPVLLDYLYSVSKVSGLPLNEDNVIPLYWLAKYFEIRRLRWETKQYWRQNLDTCCDFFYEHAFILHDEAVMDAAAQACIKKLMDLSSDSRLVHVSNPQFWLDLPQHVSTSNSETSLHVSTLIAAFCQNNTVTAEVFETLTSQE